MDWEPKTRKDRLGHNGLLTCACGRTTNADMMFDLSDLPPGLLMQLGVERHMETGLCDGCRERLFQRNPAARKILLRAMGAPGLG